MEPAIRLDERELQLRRQLAAQVPPDIQPDSVAGPRREAVRDPRESHLRGLASDLVLNCDMRTKWLPILSGQSVPQHFGQPHVKVRQLAPGNFYRNTMPNENGPDKFQWNGSISQTGTRRRQSRDLLIGQSVEERKVRRERVDIWRKISCPQRVQARKTNFVHPERYNERIVADHASIDVTTIYRYELRFSRSAGSHSTKTPPEATREGVTS
jgi:hypothetical protein